jgi:hypothetical protein
MSFAISSGMADIEKTDSLESGENISFQQGWWALERIAYPVFLLLILGGLAGVFGRGPLSRASASGSDPMQRVEYERFARFRTPTAMIVHAAPASADSTITVRITGSGAERIPVSRIVPQPEQQQPVPGGQQYQWHAASAGDTTSIRFVLEPGRVGRSESSVQINNAVPVQLSQFVYP